MEKVEIIDVARRSTIDTFTLTDGNKKVRIRSMEPDPLHRFVMLLTTTVTKLPDRFEIGAPALVQYDLAQKKITRTIPWPNGEERQNVQIQFSPDGKLMYMFSDQDVLIYDTSSFTQVDKWELSKPIEEGFGRLEFGSSDAINDEPGYYTAIFNVSDPVHNRRTMGIGRVNLAAKTVDFYTLGPSTPVGFTMAPGRKVAYGLFSEIGRYEFWKFDLVNRKLAGRTEFKGRPRMSLKTSSNGKVLYIYNAGNTIDLWDAETYQVPAHHHARRRHDQRDVRAARPCAVDDDEQQVMDPVVRRALGRGAAVLAAPGAGAGPEPRQHRHRLVGAAPLARHRRRRAAGARPVTAVHDGRAVRDRLDRHLRAEHRSAGCATRGCRRTSCSTCGSRCTATCSACRRGSTRAPGSATSCRASTTTSASCSASPPRPRSAGSATCCSSPAPSACWPGSTCGCSWSR